LSFNSHGSFCLFAAIHFPSSAPPRVPRGPRLSTSRSFRSVSLL
jgi:hypothetical protein